MPLKLKLIKICIALLLPALFTASMTPYNGVKITILTLLTMVDLQLFSHIFIGHAEVQLLSRPFLFHLLHPLQRTQFDVQAGVLPRVLAAEFVA